MAAASGRHAIPPRVSARRTASPPRRCDPERLIAALHTVTGLGFVDCQSPGVRRSNETISMLQQPDRLPAPPLAGWALTAVFAAAGLVTLVLVGSQPITPPPEAFLEFNGPRVDAFSTKSRDDGYRVLLLGNSRLKYATWPQSELDALTADASDIDVLRLVNDWATFSDFEPLLDEIFEHAPDLVVIQLELMSQERSSTANVRFLRLYLKWLLFGSTNESWNPGYLDQAGIQYDTTCAGITPTPAAVEQRLSRTGEWLTHDPQGHSALAARRFVETLRRRGVQVAFLSIPRTSEMEAARPEGALTAGSLSDAERAAIWRYPHQIPAESFCDTIHLNENGRQPFSEWLERRILATRQSAGPRHSDPAIASIAPQ